MTNTQTNASRPTVLLVHGAWHGPWCWEALRPELDQLGWRTTAVRLPSATTATTEPLPGLWADVEAISRAISDAGGPVVVIAHSYGGAPATEAVARHADKVAHLVYIAAYAPEPGQNLYAIHGLPTPDDAAGVIPVPEDPVVMFYADVEADAAARAAARLVPQTVRSWVEPVEHAGWRDVLTTYLVCDKDQALPPVLQEQLAEHAGAVQHLDSGHAPFLSMPHELAAVLDEALDVTRPDHERSVS